MFRLSTTGGGDTNCGKRVLMQRHDYFKPDGQQRQLLTRTHQLYLDISIPRRNAHEAGPDEHGGIDRAPGPFLDQKLVEFAMRHPFAV